MEWKTMTPTRFTTGVTRVPGVGEEFQHVLQSWVAEVGLKMQSIMLSGLRAPDHKTTPVKKCVRWLRSKVCIDADPSKQSYMQTVELDDALIKAAVEELEYCTCHYTHHFADAFAIVAYHHPEHSVRYLAYRMHFHIAEEIFHFMPETQGAFLERHKDKFEVASKRDSSLRRQCSISTECTLPYGHTGPCSDKANFCGNFYEKIGPR